jgi:hypothetical protein
MPSATFYATSCAEGGSTFGGDVGVGTTTWNSTAGNAAGPKDTTYATPLAGTAPASPPNWLTKNLVFSSFVNAQDAATTIAQNIPTTATLTGLDVGLWAYTDVTGILAYARVNSAATNASAGTREGGFSLSTSPISLLSLVSGASVNGIFGNRLATPIVAADLIGPNFGIVVGFYSGDATLRKPFIDAMYITATWTADGIRQRGTRGMFRSSR